MLVAQKGEQGLGSALVELARHIVEEQNRFDLPRRTDDLDFPRF